MRSIKILINELKRPEGKRIEVNRLIADQKKGGNKLNRFGSIEERKITRSITNTEVLGSDLSDLMEVRCLGFEFDARLLTR